MHGDRRIAGAGGAAGGDLSVEEAAAGEWRGCGDGVGDVEEPTSQNRDLSASLRAGCGHPVFAVPSGRRMRAMSRLVSQPDRMRPEILRWVL